MSTDRSDFTQGSILKKLSLFMLPVLGALILQAAYGAVDLLVVGRFGSTAGLSAVSTGSQILNLVTFVVTQLAMGVTVLIARYLGEKRPEQISAVLGEAVVIPQPGLIPHFFTIIKQHGALLAKGRLLGIQFDTLFTDGLYERIGADAVRYADAIRRAMAENGYLPCFPSPTNQSFCIVSEQQRKELAERVDFSVWEQYDETHSIIRFATSWATREEDVNALCRILRECAAREKAAS